VRVKPFGVLGYAEDVSLALFALGALRKLRKLPYKNSPRGACEPSRRSRLSSSGSNPVTYQTSSTAGCIDTDLPARRRNFGQSDKSLIEIAHVHHAMWVTYTENPLYSATSHYLARQLRF
jgi:hypothetical protein